MTDRARTEDAGLLVVAAAIAKGQAVDWASVRDANDPETTTVLDELRSLEDLSRTGQPIPDEWGPYRITGELGHGSYGTVYRATDEDLGLDIALKVIRPLDPDDEAAAAQALQEARLLAQVTHPNVVRIFGAERHGTEVGIAMELVQGQTLQRLMRTQGPFSANETLLIGGDLCRALAAVHGAKLLHGDIKATNVMRAQGGRTVLMDFGAGFDLKAARRRRTRTAGTPIYLAPEVLAGQPSTVTSDIYSLGVLLFYLATGTYPIEGHNRTEIEHQHQAGAPRRRLRDLRPDLPESFIHIVERATAERPDGRYQSAGELEAALTQVLRRDDRPPAPGPWPVRWDLVVAAVVVVAVLGIAYRGLTPSREAAPSGIAAVAGETAGGAPVAEPAVADAYQIEAAFYRHEGGRDVRLTSGARIAPGDDLSLQIQSSVPVYAYVVNEDERGNSFLLFPLPDQSLVNPLAPGVRHEMPGKVNGEAIRWVVNSAGGREHFLVFVTPHPPTPAFERMFAALRRPTMGAPVLAEPLSGDLAIALRGVGGLAKAPTAAGSSMLSGQVTAALPDAEETARGVWIRQLTLENPGK